VPSGIVEIADRRAWRSGSETPWATTAGFARAWRDEGGQMELFITLRAEGKGALALSERCRSPETSGPEPRCGAGAKSRPCAVIAAFWA
jgi:hypothetical protein